MGKTPRQAEVHVQTAVLQQRGQDHRNCQGGVPVKGPVADAPVLCVVRAGSAKIAGRIQHPDQLRIGKLRTGDPAVGQGEFAEMPGLYRLVAELLVLGVGQIHGVKSRRCLHTGDFPDKAVPIQICDDAVCTAVNTCWANRDTVIPALKENIESVVGTDYEDEIEIIDEMIRKKQKELLDSGRDEAKIEAIGEKIVSLRERRSQLLTQAALHRDGADKSKLMIRYIEEQDGKAEYSESLVRRLVSKITVYDEKVTVEFKTGLSIDVEA